MATFGGIGPIDYSSMLAVPSLNATLKEGFGAGLTLQKLQAEREAQRQAQLAEQQYQADIAAASANPNPKAFADLALKYPKHREAFKQGWDMLNADQQQSELRDASTLAAMLQAGKPDLALTKLQERRALMQTAGQDTATLDFLEQQIKADPKAAYGSVLQVLSGVPGGDKYLENLSKLGTERRAEEMAPFALRAAAAGATTAEVKAKFAESDALLEQEKKGWDIKALKEDIAYKKESNRIAAINASISRENNTLKRQELQMKLDEAVQKRDGVVREKVATAEAGAANIDNMLNTIERIKKNPNLNDVVGGIEGRMPALADNSVDAVALIETLGSQAFLAQIPNIKGMGALSNAEGEKLQSALQNLSRTQSEKQFRANLDEAARLLNKGRENLAKATGVPLGKPDTPAAPGSRPPLESFGR